MASEMNVRCVLNPKRGKNHEIFAILEVFGPLFDDLSTLMFVICIRNANQIAYYHSVSFWRHWMSYIALVMHIGFATYQKVPKQATLTLIAHFYPLQYSYVG